MLWGVDSNEALSRVIGCRLLVNGVQEAMDL